jgi:hypothetical protein
VSVVNAIIIPGGRMFNIFRKKNEAGLREPDVTVDLADIEVTEPPAGWTPQEVEPNTPVRDWNVDSNG